MEGALQGEKEMEIIKEIISISHNGFGEMWYPYSIESNHSCAVISSDNYYESLDVVKLIQLMFATNNHHSEMTSTNFTNRLKSEVKVLENTQCVIEFSTCEHVYRLTRIFTGNHSFEAKLERSDSNVEYYGNRVIQVLQKMIRPIIVPGEKYYSGSLILKPDSENTRLSMLNLVEKWSRMIGFDEMRIKLTMNGQWSYHDSKRFYTADNTTPSIVSLFASLSQATLRMRKYGNCPSLICILDVDDLNEFEVFTIINLATSICREERIKCLITTNSVEEIGLDNVFNTPRFSLYKTR